MIGSSSRLQLTNPILEVQIPKEKLKTQHTTPKLDRGNGIAKETDESPPNLMKPQQSCVDPKALSSQKDGQDFLKIQDAVMNVLKRESLEKLTRAKELRKKKD
ncbi:hypothetical protein Tco_0195559 [Tanacetum coccineum]